jgi:hypothetical protein
MTGRIFISYRHEGSSGDAGRICDYLKEVFGPDSLFIDSDMPVGGRLLVERRVFWKLVVAIVGLLIISVGLVLISDHKVPMVLKPSVLEEDAKSKTEPIEGIEPPPSRQAPFGRSQSGPAPSEPPPPRPPPPRPPPF